MHTITSLLPGRTYQVIREFTDYEQRVHAVGETWTFIFSKFAPSDDGMLLQIRQHGELGSFRMQWRSESQAHVMDCFTSYVRAAR